MVPAHAGTIRWMATSVRPLPVTAISKPPPIGLASASAFSVTSFMSMRCWRSPSRSTFDHSVFGSASRMRTTSWIAPNASWPGRVGVVEPAQCCVMRPQQSGSPSPSRIVDRSMHRPRHQGGTVRQRPKFGGRSEPASTPQLRTAPCADATRGCPQAPSSEFADHQDTAWSQNPSNIPKYGGGVGDEAKDRHGNNDIETSGDEGDARGLAHQERDVRAFSLSSRPRGVNHFRGSINASDVCAATP
jgi:hypothetical protein